MNFPTRSIEMFEIVAPEIEGDEVFDSGLLKQTVDAMIAAGKRNIVIDLSQHDYIYSDAINVLVVLNRRMLDVMGRLALLSPQPPVMEILRKGGMHNILRVFENDAELLRTAEDLRMQAHGLGAAGAPAGPQTEFDELRSEIGSAFGDDMTAPPAPPPPVAPPVQQAPPAAVPPAPAPAAPAPPPIQQAPPAAVPPPQETPVPPASPVAPSQEFFTVASSQEFEAPPVPPTPAVPPPLGASSMGAETRQMPVVPQKPAEEEPVDMLRPEDAFSETIMTKPILKPRPVIQEEEIEIGGDAEEITPVAPQRESFDDDGEVNFEAKPASPRGKPIRKDRFDEEFEDEAPKKSPLVPIIITLVIAAALGAGGYFAYPFIVASQFPEKANEVSSSVLTEDALPQLPVDENGPVPDAKEEVSGVDGKSAPAVAASTVEEPPKPVVKKPAAKKPAVRKATPRPVQRAAAPAPKPRLPKPPPPPPAPKAADDPFAGLPPLDNTPSSNIEVFDDPPAAPSAAEPPAAEAPAAEAPEPAAPEPAVTGEPASVFIASIPPVADIYVDGKLAGKTNISELKTTAGPHTLRFVKGDKEVTRQMVFQPGKNPSQMVRIP